jgi:tetratricopeptide (TPR) repeat protein
LHLLTITGKDESKEAEAVRDAMDVPWEGLSETERKRASGLSEDLYSISDAPAGHTQQINAQAQEELSQAVEARERGDWDRALELLRHLDGQANPGLLSFLRGSIWLDAGDPESALLFFEHALQLQPNEGKYLAIVLHTLNRVDSSAAQERARQIMAVHFPGSPLHNEPALR